MKTKTNKKRKITSIILAAAVAFAFLPAMTNADYGKAAKKPGKVTVKTSKKKPGKVKGLKVVKRGTKSVVLKWRKAKRAKKYIVYKKRVVIKCKKYDPVKMVNPYNGKKWYTYSYKVARVGKYKKAKTTKKTKVKINKLVHNSTYKFKVVAKNKKGKGKFSKEPKTKTKKGKLSKREKKIMERLTIKYFVFSNAYIFSTKYPDSKSKATHFEAWYKHDNSKWKLVGVIPAGTKHQWTTVGKGNKEKRVISKKKYVTIPGEIGRDKYPDGSWRARHKTDPHLTSDKEVFRIRACRGAYKGPFVKYDPKNPSYDRSTIRGIVSGMIGFY